MSAHLSLVEPAASATPADDAAYYRRALHALIDVGVQLVTVDIPQLEDTAEAAEAYERVTRSVRRSILLAQRSNEPARAPGEQGREVARRRIIRMVEDTIESTAEGPAAEALQAELMERVEAAELDDEIDCRPVAEIVTEIQRDLGLDTWQGRTFGKRRTPADIAALCARAAREPVPVRLGQEARPPRAVQPAEPKAAPARPGDQPRLSEDDALLLHRAMRYREP